MKRVAISYSKLRNEIGLVGIQVKGRTAHVKLVRQWNSKQVNEIVPEIQSLYQMIKWNDTYIEQETGEYFIALAKKSLPVTVIHTGKKVRDPKEIQKVKTMDKIEMTEFLRKLKLNGQIKFPEKTSKNMQKLIHEIPFFAKHTTEAGAVAYYSPGDEPDDLVRALMIACFSVRNLLQGNDGITVGGPISERPLSADVNDFENVFADVFPNQALL